GDLAPGDVVDEGVQRQVERGVRAEPADEREPLGAADRPWKLPSGLDETGQKFVRPVVVDLVAPDRRLRRAAQPIADRHERYVAVIGQIVENGTEAEVARLTSGRRAQLVGQTRLARQLLGERQMQLGGRHLLAFENTWPVALGKRRLDRIK